MSILILGGTGFIGRRLVPLLAQRGEEVVCMDINPQTANYSDLGRQVRVIRGDVSQFDDVMNAMHVAKPSRVINLAYWLGSEHPPRVAFKLNILGMDNCFEAARVSGVNRVAYASSLAVSRRTEILRRPARHRGRFPPRPCAIRDAQDLQRMAGAGLSRKARYGDYRDSPGQRDRSDKIVGSVDHVFCITDPARGKPVSFPYKDAMRCPVHVDEIAEIFARVIMKDKPEHMAYNTGGQPISMGELADIVREYLPDAQITFEKETGGKELSGNYLIDNTRLVQEFGVQYRPYRERVLQIINDIRREEGLPPISAR